MDYRDYLRPALLIAGSMMSALCSGVGVQDAPPKRGAERDPPSAPAPAAKPAPPEALESVPQPAQKTAQKAAQKSDRKPAPQQDSQQTLQQAPQPVRPRRAVRQIIEPAPAYRPTLVAPVPAPGPPLLPPPPGATPPSPVQLNACDAGGCTDVNGARYNGGVGNALIDSRGKLCTRNGSEVHCF